MTEYTSGQHMKNLPLDSLFNQFAKKRFFNAAYPKIRGCLSQCVDSFDKKEVTLREKACLEKCFYNVLENEFIEELN